MNGVLKDKIFFQAFLLSVVWHLAGFLLVGVKSDPFFLAKRLPVEVFLVSVPLRLDKPEITDILSESDYSLFSMPGRAGFSRKVLDSEIKFDHQVVVWDQEPASLRSRRQESPITLAGVLSKPEFNIKLELESKDVFAPSMIEGKWGGGLLDIFERKKSLVAGPVSVRDAVKMHFPQLPEDFKDYSDLNRLTLKFWVTPLGKVRYVIIEKSCGRKKIDQLWADAVSEWIFSEDTGTDSLDWGTINAHPAIPDSNVEEIKNDKS